MRSEGVTSPLEVSPNLGMNPSDRLRDRDGLEAAEDVLDECLPARATGAGRSMDAVKQLADRDHADSALLIADERFQDRSVLRPFPVDEKVGID